MRDAKEYLSGRVPLLALDDLEKSLIVDVVNQARKEVIDKCASICNENVGSSTTQCLLSILKLLEELK